MAQDKGGEESWDPAVMTRDPGAKAAPSPPAEARDGGDAGAGARADGSDHFEMGDLPDRPGSGYHVRPKPNRLPWLVTLLTLVGAGALVYFYHLPLVSQAKQQGAELAAVRAENSQLVEKLSSLDKQRTELEAAQAALRNTVQQKDQALNELTKTQEELAQKLQAEIQKGDVLINQREGGLVVDLVDQILFDSGAAELNVQGKAVLKKVGETFLKFPDKVIQVGGHTDNVPISSKLVEHFPSNWELSTTRATNVVRFLQDEIKIPGARLVASGFSEYRPSASNKSNAGRRKNRRIEVVLLPARALSPGKATLKP